MRYPESRQLVTCLLFEAPVACLAEDDKDDFPRESRRAWPAEECLSRLLNDPHGCRRVSSSSLRLWGSGVCVYAETQTCLVCNKWV